MNSIAVTLICTVKNEERTIKDLLDSIVNQTKQPNEVIMVDGGSSDNTVNIIRGYSDSLPIVILSSPGSNIAKGRNEAIKKSSYDIIASTDGGCKLADNWLERITEQFIESNVDIVCGVYVPWTQNEFEAIASYLIFPNLDSIKPGFMPSSRSVAFRKKAWQEVGGYPEWLETAEDSLFDLKLANAGNKFTLSKDAVVQWRVRENSKKIYKQYFNYAKGDGKELLFIKRYLPRYFILSFFALLTVMFWYSSLFWASVTSSILIALWVKYLRRVPKRSLRRYFTASLVAIAIEGGLLFGYLDGITLHIKKSLGLV